VSATDLDDGRRGPYSSEVHLALRLVHLMSAAVWFAASLTLAGDVRRSLNRGGAAAAGMVERARRVLSLSSAAGVATLATGVALIFVLGGFKVVPVRVHAGLGLALVALAIEATALGKALGAVAAAVARDDADGARAGARRIAALTGVLHLLRSAIFVVMVLR